MHIFTEICLSVTICLPIFRYMPPTSSLSSMSHYYICVLTTMCPHTTIYLYFTDFTTIYAQALPYKRATVEDSNRLQILQASRHS